MLKVFSGKKRWAVIKPHRYYAGEKVSTSGGEIIMSRSRADGSTIGMKIGFLWYTVETEELMLAVMHCTHTDEQLQELKRLN